MFNSKLIGDPTYIQQTELEQEPYSLDRKTVDDTSFWGTMKSLFSFGCVESSARK